MKGLKKLLLVGAGLLSFSLASCGNVEPVDPSKDKYTILIYMCGSDLESSYGYASGDIKEMLKNTCPEGVNIVIQTGGSKTWKGNLGISASKSQRWHIEGKSLVLDEEKSDVDMGNYINFQYFLEWGLGKYDAQKTGIVLWNHGGGIGGVCYDEKHYDNSLTTAEVAKAVKTARTKLNITKKFEWIGYDACLMNVADIASVNAEYFNYMIAAQESETGEGWDYDAWLPTLYNNPSVDTKTLLSKICDTFIADNDIYKGQDYSEWNMNTLSVLDLNKVGRLNTAVENIATALNVTSKTTFKNNVAAAYKNSLRFGGDMDEYGNVDGYLHGLADANSLAKQLKTKVSSVDTYALSSAISELVIHNAYGDYYKNLEKPCGISLFVAYANSYGGYGLQVSKTDYTTSDTKLTNWRAFNVSYGFFTE